MRPILTADLKQLLQQNDREELKVLAEEIHPADIAEAAAELEGQEVAQIIEIIGGSNALNIFEFLPLETQKDTVEYIPKQKLALMIEEMSPDNRADLVKNIDKELQERFMPYVAQAERNDIKRLMDYEEDTAGSVMTTEYVSLPSGIKAGEALESLRQQAPDKETIYDVYILDEARKLIGFLTLKQIILARSNQQLGQIMNEEPIYCKVGDDVEAVADQIAKYDLLAIPVVDNENHLMGIVTVDDVIDIVEEQNTEDFQRISAVVPLEYSYFETKFIHLFGHRLLWLVILLVMDFFSGSIIARYEGSLKALVSLTIFIPMLLDTGGNTGSQSSTMLIRALSLGEVTFKDFFTIIRRELLMGLLLGVTLSIVAFGKAWLMGESVGLGLTVGIALAVTVIVANLTGALLPLLSKLLKIDPALISSPLITTVADVVGLIVYFETARVLLF
ncbi:MAG: magnesium transporter [Candidatus Schekmanbacteria bacterium]|nr:magnesium transporter [Candidatus Schekmanbacteria bacterium]